MPRTGLRSQEAAGTFGSSGGSGKGEILPQEQPLNKPTSRPRDPSLLYLCIRTSSVSRYANSVLSHDDVLEAYATSSPDTSQGYLDLLEGDFTDLEHFAGEEHSCWFIDVAHGLCDPRQKRGALWFGTPMARPVLSTRVVLFEHQSTDIAFILLFA
ncbi:hypothetical protein BT96DRAFT_978421 [Gymnopus androsaceus JB14]|uniref:Uncharacterized protein n=1 Tax=Gymnopus androsaceus JB14 TaxID=1447944 RepID=A0A6A4HC13_9AGAR|nr:hypothetical protein BT96DRAFT_978421 [Gymnopus androsaceus JB14]